MIPFVGRRKSRKRKTEKNLQNTFVGDNFRALRANIFVYARAISSEEGNGKKYSLEESGEELDGSMKEEYEKRMIGVRYRELCQLTNQLVTRAALTSETTDIVKNGMLKFIDEVDSSLEARTLISHLRAKNKTKDQLSSRDGSTFSNDFTQQSQLENINKGDDDAPVD